MKNWVPFITFSAVIVAFFVGLRRDPAAIPYTLNGQMVPDFSRPLLHKPDTFLTPEQLTGRPYILNVFGSWCVPCRIEHEFLNALPNEITMVGVNWRDSREDALNWLDALGDPYDFVVFDPSGELVIDLAVTGAPETLFVDAAGVIQHKHIGPLDVNIWKEEFLPLLAKAEADAGAL